MYNDVHTSYIYIYTSYVQITQHTHAHAHVYVCVCMYLLYTYMYIDLHFTYANASYVVLYTKHSLIIIAVLRSFGPSPWSIWQERSLRWCA